MKVFHISLLLLLISGSLCAENEKSEPQKSEAQKTATTVVTYPVNVVREAGEVVLGVGQKTLQTGADTAQVTGQVLTGDVKKAPEIVVTPLKGTAEGLVETTTATVSIPAEALKDSQEAAK